MSKILEALDEVRKQQYQAAWHHPAIKQYVMTGDPAQLAATPHVSYRPAWEITHSIPDPDAWTDEAQRLLSFAVARSVPDLFKGWLAQFFRYTSGRPEHFEAAVRKLREHGMSDVTLRAWVMEGLLCDDKGEPNAAGRMVLEASDQELASGLRVHGNHRLVRLLAKSDLARLERLLDAGAKPHYLDSAFADMVRANPARFHERAFQYCTATAQADAKAGTLAELADKMPEKYFAWASDQMKQAVRSSEGTEDYQKRSFCEFLLAYKDPEALPVTLEWMAMVHGNNPWNAPHQRELILKAAAEKTPQWVGPMAEACARCNAGRVILLGLKYWKAHGIGDAADRYHAALQRLLSASDGSLVVAGISECREWDLRRTQEDIWPLLQHKSRPARGAAARALAGLGFEEAGARATKLLAHSKADVRLAAVSLLGQMSVESALRPLKQRLDVEENDDVRDAILVMLENSGGGASFSPAEVAERISKTLAKSKTPPAAWIDPGALTLKRRDGSALSRDEVLYLLIRQSRCKEMRADLEAKPLYASLDRAACGPAALSVIQAFLGTGQDAADRWVLAFAALTGDDRIVPVISRAITDWADRQRGKLAEYAAQALALLGTEAALMVVDSLSVRYRSKNKNIGQAAADAFTAAAEQRGVSVEELGDLVVPWLGFEPGKPRVVNAGKTNVEVRISDDFKIVFRDTSSGKVLAKLPASSGAEAQAEFKALAATLKEAVKAQLLRIETLLVRQFRWPVARWRELYLAHPLLQPFTQRLLWALRGEDGVIAKTFRALEDSSLTDLEDNAVELSSHGTIALVHPLELDERDRQAWVQHLADYNIAPPFPQLDRPAVIVKDEERAMKFGKHVEGTSLNAMTFRSRAEKLGWARGSVVDAGGVTSYRKTFSGAGIDAFLSLDGMYVGIGMEESITLGTVCFVPSGSVKTGSYTYDEPGKEDDPRLITFGGVPTVPFSEVMGDLTKISGKTADAPVETA